MLKKVLFSVIAFCMLGAGTVSASEQEIPDGTKVDSVSGASVTDYYVDYGISGDELMEAVNAPSGSYVIATVNEDGSPLLGYFIYSMIKEEDDYYLLLGLAENQTRENLIRTGEAMALYAANPESEAPAQYAVSGARMGLELVTDEGLIEKLNTAGYDTTMFCKVKWVRSLG